MLLNEPLKSVLLAYESGSGPRPERVARVWVTNPPVGHLFEALVLLPEGTAAATGSKDLVRQWTHVSGLMTGACKQLACLVTVGIQCI